MLISDAFRILSLSNTKIADLGEDYVDQAGSPKQPKTLQQLIRVRQLYNLLMKFILINDAGTKIVGTLGQNDDALNRLLLELKNAAGIFTYPAIPNPIHSFITENSYGPGSSLPFTADEGSFLYFHNNSWQAFFNNPNDGDSITWSPSGPVWSAAVGNGIPSGGSLGQVLKKSSNISYNVFWDTLDPSDIGVSSSAAELNLLDGALWSTAESNTLVGINTGESIQSQLNSKLGTSLANGQFFVGNGSGIATAVASSGDVTFSNAGVFSITPGIIDDADINSSAAITRSKLASGTANRLVVNSSLGVMSDAAAITASRVLVSDANGIPTHSSMTTTQLGFYDISSSLQGLLNDKLSVNISSVAQGDSLQYNGTDWINIPIGTSGQVPVSNGVSWAWGDPIANGIPSGGSAHEYLRKIDGTNYNTEWHALVMADITNVSTTATELNLLSGLTATASVLNYSTGLTDYIQTQLNDKLNNSLALNSIWVGGGGNTPQQVSAGVDGSVLTIVSGAPVWQSPPTPGDVTGPVSSTDNAIVRWNSTGGISIQDSGVIIDDSDNITGIASISSGQHSILDQAALRLYETGSGNYVGIRASGSMSADYTITFPAAAPSSNTYLKYDGSDYVWASASVVSFGTEGQIPFMNSTDDDFDYSSKFTWDDTDNNFIAGNGTIVSGTNNHNLGDNTSITGSWVFTSAESATIYGNNSISGGWTHEIGDGVNFGSGSGTSTFGVDHKNYGRNSHISGIGGQIDNNNDLMGGFVHAFNSPSIDGLKPTGIEYVLATDGAFNVSQNTAAQTAGHGAMALLSVILGGRDHNIPSDSPRSAIFGGNAIKARAGDPDNVYVPYFNITQITQDDALTQIVARDGTTGKLFWRDASTIGGGGGTSDWGDIGGTITDQTDLVSYVSAQITASVVQATSSVAGIAKLYTDLAASNTDGSVSQAAIKSAIDEIRNKQNIGGMGLA